MSTISCISEEEFLKLTLELLRKMEIDGVNIENGIGNKLKDISIFIRENPNNMTVRYFIYEFINLYKKVFLNQDLIYALSTPEYLHYYRQLQIYKNLPSTTHPAYPYYLPHVLEIPSNLFNDFYNSFIYIINKYYPNLIATEYLQILADFFNSNDKIRRGSKDSYLSLDEEKALYFNPTYEALEEFLETERKQLSPKKLLTSFKNKKLGNIGELYAYELFKTYPNSCLVARDIKNGFGYDIYFMGDDQFEHLIEVKTTREDKEDDSFTVSENEYRVMKECLTNKNAVYTICRVFLDEDLNPSYMFLSLKDEVTLITNDGNITYKLNGSNPKELKFKRQPQIRKILSNN